MAEVETFSQLVEGPIPPLEAEPASGATGAQLLFQGIVRDEENGEPIVALFYEAYAEMAEKELRNVCDEAGRLYQLQRLQVWHRIGDVPVNEASLQIVMRSRHRETGLEAMAWLIREIKQRLPIWKWGIAPDGRRFPSAHGEHDHAPATEHELSAKDMRGGRN